MYFSSSVLILIGVLAMRWNVVIGGQLFSKSLRGVMSYKMEFAGLEGWFMGAMLLALPFVILTVFVKLFLSERLPTEGHVPHRDTDRSNPAGGGNLTQKGPAAADNPLLRMNNAEKTNAVLVVLAVVFVLLALKFATGFGAPAPALARIPLVDTNFLDTATFRQSYAELIRTKADLSDFDCYACHTKGKPPTLAVRRAAEPHRAEGARGHCDAPWQPRPE